MILWRKINHSNFYFIFIWRITHWCVVGYFFTLLEKLNFINNTLNLQESNQIWNSIPNMEYRSFSKTNTPNSKREWFLISFHHYTHVQVLPCHSNGLCGHGESILSTVWEKFLRYSEVFLDTWLQIIWYMVWFFMGLFLS